MESCCVDNLGIQNANINIEGFFVQILRYVDELGKNLIFFLKILDRQLHIYIFANTRTDYCIQQIVRNCTIVVVLWMIVAWRAMAGKEG